MLVTYKPLRFLDAFFLNYSKKTPCDINGPQLQKFAYILDVSGRGVRGSASLYPL